MSTKNPAGVVCLQIEPINSLAPGRCGSNFKSVIFENDMDQILEIFCEIALWWMPKSIFGSGNGLVPDDTKPLPEPMLT